jgi:cyanophycinase
VPTSLLAVCRPKSALILFLALTLAQPCRAENGAPHAEPPKGRLFLMGGAERADNPVVWPELVRLAGGKGARIAIFATGSRNPERSGAALSEQLRDLGLDPFVVPVAAAPASGTTGDRGPATDSQWVERVRQANAVFLGAGVQSRHRQALVDDAGRDTPLLEAIRYVYKRGGLVAGTSAGTAIMSRIMFIDADFVLQTLLQGTRKGREVDDGFGLVPAEWFIDQHCLVRGRFARALVAMQTTATPFGLGIDEDTSVVIEQGRTARVVGHRGAVILDLSQATHDAKLGKFNLRKARLSFLSHGDQIDLTSRQVTIDPEKRPTDKIDLQKPGYKPNFDQRLFYNDMLGNMVLLDLMYRLADSPHEEAIGLAFDGPAARLGETVGFEFRFYRGADTVSWNAHRSHGDSHTVANVYLDIRPITIHGPLYD